MIQSDIFHPDFKTAPYWWEAYRPTIDERLALPSEARVAIVGGGYAGLSTALELSKHGIDAVVLERGALGEGASTRNGGAVSGGVNVGKSFSGKPADVDPVRAGRMLSDAYDAFALVERLIDEEAIDLLLAETRAFCRRVDAASLHLSAIADRQPQRQCSVGRLYGRARAPAR